MLTAWAYIYAYLLNPLYVCSLRDYLTDDKGSLVKASMTSFYGITIGEHPYYSRFRVNAGRSCADDH